MERKHRATYRKFVSLFVAAVLACTCNGPLLAWAAESDNGQAYEEPERTAAPKVANTTAHINGEKGTVELLEANLYVIADEVTCTNLQADGSYFIGSTLYLDGAQIEYTERVFSGEEGEASVLVEFSERGLEPGKYSVKTELYADGELVDTHNGNLDIESETINVTVSEQLDDRMPDIGTQVSYDSLDAEEATEKTSLVAAIGYRDFEPGATYTVTGRLMENGATEVARATQDFIADDSGYGVWDMTIGFAAGTLRPGMKYVVFETAVNKNNTEETITHDDASVPGQTFFVDCEPVKVELTANKVLNGGTLREGQFSFTLEETEAILEEDDSSLQEGATVAHKFRSTPIFLPQRNDAEGKITFTTTLYDAGTYTYEMTETTLGEEGVTYDKSVKKIVVTVMHEGTKLVAKIEGNNPTFTNTYTAEPESNKSATEKPNESTPEQPKQEDIPKQDDGGKQQTDMGNEDSKQDNKKNYNGNNRQSQTASNTQKTTTTATTPARTTASTTIPAPTVSASTPRTGDGANALTMSLGIITLMAAGIGVYSLHRKKD